MKFRDILSLVMLADRYSFGEVVELPKEYRDQLSKLNLPESLRQLVVKVNKTLLRKQDVPEEEIETFTEIINEQGVKGMFEKWGDYSVRELRIQFAEEAREKSRQHYEPLLAEKDQRLAALERENAELRKMQGFAPSV
jgi:sulfur carrier protein ThiS